VTEAKRELPLHLRVPWGIPSALLLYFVVWIAISFSIAIYAELLAPFIPGLAWFSTGLANNDIYANFIFTSLNTILGFLAIWLFLRHFKVGWRDVGWRKFNVWKAALYILAIFLAFVVLANLSLWIISVLVPAFNATQAQNNEFTTPQASSHHILVLIALVVFPAILEETAFRGYIFPAISKRLGLIWGAILSSLLFAFAHLQFNIGVYTFVLGLLLCFMYVKLKSIIPGIFFHAINNALALSAMIHFRL
jgi:membrane protease YdiL (CAAX protease family)